MAELAEDSFSFVVRSPQQEKAYTEKRRAVESLTDVGSFQPHSVRMIQEARAVTSNIYLPYGSGKTAVILAASLGPASGLAIGDVGQSVFQGERIVGRALREIPAVIIADVSLLPLQGKTAASLLGRENVLRASLSPVIQPEPEKPQRVVLEIVEEAKRRLAGHESLEEKLVSIVKQSAAALDISLKRIVVRPGWSHEYEDTTSVVVYVETDGSHGKRFALWDAICDGVERLSDLLPEKARQFVTQNLFITVIRD